MRHYLGIERTDDPPESQSKTTNEYSLKKSRVHVHYDGGSTYTYTPREALDAADLYAIDSIRNVKSVQGVW